MEDLDYIAIVPLEVLKTEEGTFNHRGLARRARVQYSEEKPLCYWAFIDNGDILTNDFRAAVEVQVKHWIKRKLCGDVKIIDWREY